VAAKFGLFAPYPQLPVGPSVAPFSPSKPPATARQGKASQTLFGRISGPARDVMPAFGNPPNFGCFRKSFCCARPLDCRRENPWAHAGSPPAGFGPDGLLAPRAELGFPTAPATFYNYRQGGPNGCKLGRFWPEQTRPPSLPSGCPGPLSAPAFPKPPWAGFRRGQVCFACVRPMRNGRPPVCICPEVFAEAARGFFPATCFEPHKR